MSRGGGGDALPTRLPHAWCWQECGGVTVSKWRAFSLFYFIFFSLRGWGGWMVGKESLSKELEKGGQWVETTGCGF